MASLLTSVGLTTQKPQFVYPLTDLGNAQMFYRIFGGKVYVEQESGAWIAWNGKHFLTGESATMMVMRRYKKIVTARYRQAKSRSPLCTRNDEIVTQKDALNWAKATSQFPRMKAMLNMFRDMPGVRISKNKLDQAPYLLGVASGDVIDLRTGTLIQNRPGLLITRYANAGYDPSAKAPIFLQFMSQICLGRQNLIDYLQEILGYSLSGLIKEHAFFLLVGTGANGKSTLIETFLHLLGEYGIGMPSHAFLKSNSRAIRNDIARLPGVRFAQCAEVNTGMNLDESMVKRATGGDNMTARYLGKEFFDFHPSAKLFLSLNTLPKIKGADDGIYRRLVVIPFDGDFQTNMDRDLTEKLKAEINGILLWAIEGFMRWYKRGYLNKPTCVVEACTALREEMDPVASFLNDMCITGNSSDSTPLGVLYDAYVQWTQGSLTEPEKKQSFSTLMIQKGFKRVKSGSWLWKGVALKAAPATNTGNLFGTPFGTPRQPQPSTADTASSTTGLTQ